MSSHHRDGRPFAAQRADDTVYGSLRRHASPPPILRQCIGRRPVAGEARRPTTHTHTHAGRVRTTHRPPGGREGEGQQSSTPTPSPRSHHHQHFLSHRHWRRRALCSYTASHALDAQQHCSAQRPLQHRDRAHSSTAPQPGEEGRFLTAGAGRRSATAVCTVAPRCGKVPILRCSYTQTARPGSYQLVALYKASKRASVSDE